MANLPLYGVRYAASGPDPLYWVRSILASNRGTLMELGVGPVVTAGTAMQLATASGLLRVDQNVLATAIALGEAAAHVLLGAYGPVGALNGALIVLQLLSATAVVVFLDDLFDKGYGLRGSSAVALLSATNNCGKVFWQAFSPVTVNTGRGPEFEGIVLAVVYQAVARAGNAPALAGTLLRRHLPNAMGLLATCLVLLAAVFLEGVQMPLPLPLQSRDGRGRRATFPIKLLYTSTMPNVLHSAAVTALYLVSQLLHYSRFGGGALARLLRVWKEDSHAAVPVGGLAYYLTPPSSAAADPLHALVYAVLLASCAVLSQAWAVGLTGQMWLWVAHSTMIASV
ncbi:hypothetical protein C2845_PM12G17790 [Panicum miliaceum]|uniref:Translocon Sec61/SecY plug domain-containing protein n=1 Tax=Panicum miliaceum TaxID=4540 RepID=A0A3L6QJM6_PANMI|nr:hypothetical protein C2845_PM12G17790 [Panicum miliaceum]